MGNKNGGVYDNSETEFMLRHVTHDIMKTTNDKEEEKKGIRAKIKKNIEKKIGKLSGKIGKNISDIYRRKKQKKREIEEKEKEIEEEKKTIPWFEHYDWSETINSKISSSNTNTYEDGGKSLPILLPQSATPDINEINEINEITHRFRRGEPRGARMENIKNKIIDIKNLFHGEENEKGEKFEGLHTSHNEILAIIKNIEVVSDIIIQKTFQKFKPDIKNLLINLNKIVLEKEEREDIKKVGESYSNIYNTIETIMKDFEKNIGGATEKYQEALWKSRQKKDSSEWKDKQEDNIMILQNFKKFYNRVKNFTKNHNNFNYQWNKKNSITEIEKVKIFLKKCGHEIYGDTIIKTEDQKKYESSSFYKLFKKIWHGMLKVKKNLNARKYQLESTLADTFPLGKKKSFEYALKDMFFDYQCILMPLDILEQVIPYCNNSFGPNHEQKVDLFNFNKIDKDESALVIKNYNMISEMSIQKFKKKIGDDGNVLKKYFNLKEACESTFKRRGIGSGRVSTHLRKNLLKDVFPEKFLKMHIKAWSTYYHDSNVQKINKIDIKKMKDNSDKEKNQKINKIKDEINKLRDEINKSEDESEEEKTIKSEKELLDKEKYFFDYLNKKYDEKINRNKKKMDNIKEKQVYFYNWERKITMYFSDDFICENKDNQQKFQKMLENYEKKINIRISDCNYIYKMQGRSLMDNTSRSLTYDANVVHQYDMKNDRSDLTLKNAMKIAMGNTIRMGGKLKFGINGYDTDSREETKITLIKKNDNYVLYENPDVDPDVEDKFVKEYKKNIKIEKLNQNDVDKLNEHLKKFNQIGKMYGVSDKKPKQQLPNIVKNSLPISKVQGLKSWYKITFDNLPAPLVMKANTIFAIHLQASFQNFIKKKITMSIFNSGTNKVKDNINKNCIFKNPNIYNSNKNSLFFGLKEIDISKDFNEYFKLFSTVNNALLCDKSFEEKLDKENILVPEYKKTVEKRNTISIKNYDNISKKPWFKKKTRVSLCIKEIMKKYHSKEKKNELA